MTVMTTSMPAAASVLGEGRGETLFRVCGAAPLRGTVDIKGAKNAALPIIAATLLSAEPCILENVPDIADIRLMMAVLRHLGARVANALHAALRLEVLLVAIVDESVQIVRRLQDDVSATPAIATIRPTIFDELLATESDAARAAIAGFDVELRLIKKLHVF